MYCRFTLDAVFSALADYSSASLFLKSMFPPPNSSEIYTFSEVTGSVDNTTHIKIVDSQEINDILYLIVENTGDEDLIVYYYSYTAIADDYYTADTPCFALIPSGKFLVIPYLDTENPEISAELEARVTLIAATDETTFRVTKIFME